MNAACERGSPRASPGNKLVIPRRLFSLAEGLPEHGQRHRLPGRKLQKRFGCGIGRGTTRRAPPTAPFSLPGSLGGGWMGGGRVSFAWQLAGQRPGLFPIGSAQPVVERGRGGAPTSGRVPRPFPRRRRRRRRHLHFGSEGSARRPPHRLARSEMKRPAVRAARGGGASRLGLWALLLALPAAGALKVGAAHRETQPGFFQQSFPSEKEAGQFMFQFDDEELLHVDWGEKTNVWRLQELTRVMDFQVQGALGNLDILKGNLGHLVKRSNRSQEENVPPSATVYTEDPVELGEPNVLICFVDHFFPPVLNITWLKNGQVASVGAQETGFLSGVDNTFRKFSYLPVVPEEGDVYACQVDHWGLQESLTRPWYPKVPPPVSEVMENALCGLGLTLGVLGTVAGTVLFFKAKKRNKRASSI